MKLTNLVNQFNNDTVNNNINNTINNNTIDKNNIAGNFIHFKSFDIDVIQKLKKLNK